MGSAAKRCGRSFILQSQYATDAAERGITEPVMAHWDASTARFSKQPNARSDFLDFEMDSKWIQNGFVSSNLDSSLANINLEHLNASINLDQLLASTILDYLLASSTSSSSSSSNSRRMYARSNS